MNMNEIINSILSSNEGAVLCRTAKTNFIAIPTGDANQPFVKVAVSNALAKDTKVNKAFDVVTAHAEYEKWIAEQTAKANTPKKERGVNVEAQARRDAMDAVLTEFINSKMDGEMSATDVLNGCKDVLPEGTMVMAVGSSLMRLADIGIVTFRLDGKKKIYAKA